MFKRGILGAIWKTSDFASSSLCKYVHKNPSKFNVKVGMSISRMFEYIKYRCDKPYVDFVMEHKIWVSNETKRKILDESILSGSDFNELFEYVRKVKYIQYLHTYDIETNGSKINIITDDKINKRYYEHYNVSFNISESNSTYNKYDTDNYRLTVVIPDDSYVNISGSHSMSTNKLLVSKIEKYNSNNESWYQI
jgi:hypothetical protein